VAKGRAESRADKPELAPDTHTRGAPPDLRGRLAELPGAHPSAAEYGSDRAAQRAAGSPRRPDKPAESPDKPAESPDKPAESPDKPAASPAEADGREQRPGRESRSETAAADQIVTGDVRLTADRRTHILDGDKTGGGHRPGTGRPAKTEFPADWGDDRIIDAVLAVAAKPDEGPERQRWRGRWRLGGEHEGVRIVAVVESDG
jgi:hypothetical protein